MGGGAMATETLPRAATVEGLLQDWADALLTRDPAQVTALYAPDAVLVPTIADWPRKTPADIADYFEEFLAGGPVCRVVEGTIRPMGEVAVHSGVYRFRMTALEGRPVIDARFTFVYQRIHRVWKIVAHHSSAMPEA